MTFVLNVLHVKIYGICMHPGSKTAHENKRVMSRMLCNFPTTSTWYMISIFHCCIESNYVVACIKSAFVFWHLLTLFLIHNSNIKLAMTFCIFSFQSEMQIFLTDEYTGSHSDNNIWLLQLKWQLLYFSSTACLHSLTFHIIFLCYYEHYENSFKNKM